MFLFFHCCCCEIFLKWIAIEIALVKKAACAACIIKWTVCKLVFCVFLHPFCSQSLSLVRNCAAVIHVRIELHLRVLQLKWSLLPAHSMQSTGFFSFKFSQFSVRRHVLICIGGAIFIALYIYYRSWLFQNVSSVWVTHITHAYTITRFKREKLRSLWLSHMTLMQCSVFEFVALSARRSFFSLFCRSKRFLNVR